MGTDRLARKIKVFFQGEVLTDLKTLKLYSHDTSLFEVEPQLVVFPLDSDDVCNLVEFVKRFKKVNPGLSLTARSGGTDMTGGAINDSIIVDFSKHFNEIGRLDFEGVVVQPGVFYRDFEKKTLEKQLILPSYPASRNICAIGGIISNNSGGEKTLTYGKTIDYVKKLKMVLSDGETYEFEKLNKRNLEKKLKQDDFEGEIYRRIYKICEDNYDLIKGSKPKVSKNSTGYNIWDVWDREYFDLTKLFVGAQGTLGLNIEAELGLVEAKKHSGLLVIYLNDINILPELINDVLKTKPDSFEAFDDHTLKLALKFMPQFIYILGFLGTIKMGFQFLPDLLMFAIKGVPKFTLLVEFESNDLLEIAGKIEKLRDSVKHFPIRTELAEKDSEAKNYWVIRRESFNLLRKNVKNRHTAPFIDDFIINPEYLVEFFPKLIMILDEYKIDYTVAGHMGDGNFHIIPLMDFSKKSERDKIPVVEEKVNQLVLDYHGSISAEHNEGLIRGYYLEKMYGKEMFEIFKEIKNIFDPQNIFNPNKKTDAKLEYSLNHIRTRF